MTEPLFFTDEQVRELTAHLDRNLPEEACGLVAGSGQQVQKVLPVENELHSPVRFQMAPLEQLKAFEQIEADGLNLLAIFHSHPNGPDHPSQTDVSEFYYPGVAVLIASPVQRGLFTGAQSSCLAQGSWQIKGYWIEKDEILAVKLGLIS